MLAAVEAACTDEFNIHGVLATTMPVGPVLIVNGPARDDLGIDYRASCMGGAAGRGSMTIGRAVALCLRNVGGQRAGETTKSVFGPFSNDGKPSPVTGVPDFDESTYKQVNDTTVESTRLKAGKPVQTGTRVLSADGKTLTFSSTGTNASGQQINNVAVYDKQ